MTNWQKVLVLVACVLSAILGFILALILREPEVVVQDRLVEVTTPAQIDDQLLTQLTAEYLAIGGTAEEFSENFVMEVWGSVCADQQVPEEFVEEFGVDPDAGLTAEEFLSFSESVASNC